MKKAHLLCPQERVFFNELLIDRPALPHQSNNTTPTMTIEVEVLGIDGEQALVLLPNVMATEEKMTATVEIEYLNFH
jgi:hypothetical protein